MFTRCSATCFLAGVGWGGSCSRGAVSKGGAILCLTPDNLQPGNGNVLGSRTAVLNSVLEPLEESNLKKKKNNASVSAQHTTT